MSVVQKAPLPLPPPPALGAPAHASIRYPLRMTPCPRCASPVDAGARFCTECGTWVVHPATPMTGVPIPSGLAMPASFVGGGAIPTLNTDRSSSEDTTPQGQPPRGEPAQSGVVGPKRTAIKSVPPPAALLPPQSPARTDVGRVRALSPLSRSDIPGVTSPSPAHSIEAPVSKVAKTLVDTPSSTPAHTVGKSKRKLGAFLVSFQYEPLGAFWPLAVGPNLFGRSGLGARPDLDIGLADTTVSTEQAIIHVEPGHVGIEDCGSKNGTFVNGRPLLSGVRAPLNNGDRIRFGSFETLVVLVPTPP